MVDLTTGREVNVGMILSRAGEIVARNWIVCLVGAVALGLSEALASIAARRWLGIGLGSTGGQLGLLVRPVLGWPMNCLIQYLVIGRVLSVEQLTDLGWSPVRFLGYIVTSMLIGIASIFGFVLLIVPGILVLIRLAMAKCFVIGRGIGPVEAMKASWIATRGSGWPIFGAIMMVLLSAGLGSLIIGGFVGHAGLAGSITELVVVKSFSGVMGMAVISVNIAIFALLGGSPPERTGLVFA